MGPNAIVTWASLALAGVAFVVTGRALLDYARTPFVGEVAALSGAALALGVANAAGLGGSALAPYGYVVGAGLCVAALCGHWLTVFRSPLALRPYDLVPQQSDTERLSRAALYVGTELLCALTRFSGRREAERASEEFNEESRRLGWKLRAQMDRLVGDYSSATAVGEAAQELRLAFGALASAVSVRVGSALLRRLLTAIYDRLHWEDRELISEYLFKGSAWAGMGGETEMAGEPDRLAILRNIFFLTDLPETELRALASLFRPRTYQDGHVIIRQGETGDRFYCLQAGRVQVIVQDTSGIESVVGYLEAGDYFGELALLESVPRTATVKAVGQVAALELAKEHFEVYVGQAGDAAQSLGEAARGVRALEKMPLFSELSQVQLARIFRSFTQERFPADATIIRQGDESDRFYVIHEGRVAVLDESVEGGRRVATLSAGEYFGEIALLQDVRRTATVRAETDVVLWSLAKGDFLPQLAMAPRAGEALQMVSSRRLHELRRRQPVMENQT